MSHTPGPWTVDRRVSTRVVGPDDRGICSSGGYHNNRQDPTELEAENQANARLIAAAPELRAIVERIAAHFKDTDAPLGLDAAALLQKIDGEQP